MNISLCSLQNLFQESKEDEDGCKTTILPSLCSDSVYEILTRIPLYNLQQQCQWVCEDWRKVINQTNFKLLHAQRTQTISGYFFERIRTCKYSNEFISIFDPNDGYRIPVVPSLDFLPENIIIEASSNGLLCCVSESKKSNNLVFYICKPTTREWRKIPRPRLRFLTETIAMVVNQPYPNLSYKILRLSRPKTAPGYHCELFDSNKWAWKRLEDVNLPAFILCSGYYRGIFANVSFHWLTDDNRVFSFHIDNEKWTTIELPQKYTETARMKLIEYEGEIAVVYTTDDLLELWVLENQCTWRKMCDIDLEKINAGNSNSVLDLYSAETALMSNCYKVIRYDFSNNSCTEIESPGKINDIHRFYPFESDLVSWKRVDADTATEFETRQRHGDFSFSSLDDTGFGY